MANGESIFAEISDNGPTVEPYFNETWGCCPSLLPAAKQTALRDLCVATLKCLGFESGVFHVEAKNTSKGPRLIEVNARMGGGQVRETILRVWGVDLAEETMLVACGAYDKTDMAVPKVSEYFDLFFLLRF